MSKKIIKKGTVQETLFKHLDKSLMCQIIEIKFR